VAYYRANYLGYPQKPVFRVSQETRPKIRRIQSLTPRAIPPTTILLTPQNTPFINDQEYLYFRLFCDEIASSLAGYFKDSLWTQLILQAWGDTPPIRLAIIAIGALGKTLDVIQGTQSPFSSNLLQGWLEGSTHH
jgi:hypothetical protein